MIHIAKFSFKRILPCLITVMMLFSCADELDLQPLDSFSNETFWTSESNALLALTGVYRGNIQQNNNPEFRANDWWSYYGLLFLDMATDNAYDRRGDNAPFSRLSNGQMNSNNVNLLAQYWERSYQKIARSNYFLENVDKTPAAPEVIERMKAEARFMRAVQYFYMSQYYGSVPLVTSTLSIDEANTLTKTPKSEIVAYVIDEFSAIVDALPQASEMPATEFGRATKQVVLAFLARMQLAEQRYSDAAATYERIINFGDHSIDPDYESLFNGTNESSPEIIFSTIYLSDLAGNGLLQHGFPAVRGGWHIFNPLGSLVESYEFIDGTPFSYENPLYNPEDVRENRDPRLGYTVLVNNQEFGEAMYITHPDSVNSIDQLTTTRQATRTGFGMKKFMLESFSGDLGNSGIDLPIIRYAEILLGYLEAKLEAGDPIDQGLLDATINQVRGRASVNMPPVTETDPDALRTILRRERRNEFAFEGIRYWDLIRWRTAHEVLQGSFYGASFPDAVNLRQDGEEVDPYSRWFVTRKSFREDVDYQWPIPQGEININPNLAD
ncbi:RagB/SusD family nutrient uptake outer membrane protein [Catalinimonas sp. 4WD22]|uniref:RagB/SusD family nutrient uptake outer membrane protein n=1 Tax=Catalinimonas locisalis TaxID=3133978 RepID=UPI0031015CD5